MNTIINAVFSVLHLFCGLGGGAIGFQRAGFETLLGIDINPAACADFRTLTKAPALAADLAAMSPDELRAACGGRRPDVVFASPPCKAFSGCLPLARSQTPTYQAMSDLSLRGVWLVLEAWPDAPPPLILLENVPRIQSRGAEWLAQIEGLLRGYGYAVRRSTHDCGELGGLAQRRRRFLLVARHIKQIPEVLYEPPHRGIKGCGEVLSALPVPVPGGMEGGPMHILPKMSALNWARLALIPAGQDWRALRNVEAVYALSPSQTRQNGPLGVQAWDDPTHTVIAHATPGGAWACVADPRINPRREGALGVTAWGSPSTTVIANGIPQNGPWQVADPRLNHAPRPDSWGVVGWATPTHTIRAVEKTANGAASVADPRVPAIEGEGVFDLHSPRPIHLVIRALDGTWHRPLTTLELAALQGLPVGGCNGGWLKLDGNSHKAWRERIGNAVPPPAAEAIAHQMKKTLLAARAGELLLSSTPVWVERGLCL